MSRTMVSIGEKKFLRDFLQHLYVDPSFVNGFGHDASVIDVGLEDWLLIMKIDRAAKPIAALQGWSDYKLWGRIAVTSNCSDILASGGFPNAVMVAVSIPGSWQAKDVMDIILGCEEECRRWGAAFVGGDTKESAEPQVIGSAVGLVKRGSYLPRNQAKPGQSVVLAGLLGGYVGSYLQLTYLDPATVPPKKREQWLHYITHPTAKWLEASAIRQFKCASAGMDTSDGLYEALIAMTGTQLGVEIKLESLPYHSSAVECSEKLCVPLFNTAFGVGDWNIVFAVEDKSIDRLMTKAAASGSNLTVIGKFTDTPSITAQDSDGNRYKVNGVINEHFRTRMEDQKDFMEQIKSQVSLFPI